MSGKGANNLWPLNRPVFTSFPLQWLGRHSLDNKTGFTEWRWSWEPGRGGYKIRTLFSNA